MQTNNIFGSMDEKTFSWLSDCILTAPDINSLEGIRHSIEWFYDIDKDLESFEKLINLILDKQKQL